MKPVQSILWEIQEKKRTIGFWDDQKNIALYHIRNRKTEMSDLKNRLKGIKCSCGHSALKHIGRYGCQHQFAPGSQHDFQDVQGNCVCVEFDLSADKEQKA